MRERSALFRRRGVAVVLLLHPVDDHRADRLVAQALHVLGAEVEVGAAAVDPAQDVLLALAVGPPLDHAVDGRAALGAGGLVGLGAGLLIGLGLGLRVGV